MVKGVQLVFSSHSAPIPCQDVATFALDALRTARSREVQAAATAVLVAMHATKPEAMWYRVQADRRLQEDRKQVFGTSKHTQHAS